MAAELGKQERQSLAGRVGMIRSGLLMLSWTIGLLRDELDAPTGGSRCCELAEGQSFLLDLLAGELSAVYQTINVE